MTKAYSSPDDNGGRCESCNRPESVYEPQSGVKVLLGGGIGWSTMYLCPSCVKERHARKLAATAAETAPTPTPAEAPEVEVPVCEDCDRPTCLMLKLGPRPVWISPPGHPSDSMWAFRAYRDADNQWERDRMAAWDDCDAHKIDWRSKYKDLEAAVKDPDHPGTKALDAIAEICGCPEWEYPAQVVRDVLDLKARCLTAERALASIQKLVSA